MALPDGLLADTKNYLGITWDDADTDSNLSGMLSRGIVYIDRLSGTSNDYTVEGPARELLLTRVRYERAGALADFDRDYGTLIREFQDDSMAANWVIDDETTD
jgi:hypothetical protein